MRLDALLCPNPGPFTGPGTNTYLLGDDELVVVLDPGPVIETHRQAIVTAVGDRSVAAVLVTHTHPDHAPLANPLGEYFGAPTAGFAAGPDFSPDRTVADTEIVLDTPVRIQALHTPGHTADHLCYLVDGALFTGDHIMGGSTVIIEDALAYMQSLERLRDVPAETLYPGHGPVLDDPAATIDEYIAHRRMREQQVLDAIGAGAHTIEDIVDAVYTEVPFALRGAAAHQVRTQLTKLYAEGKVRWPAEAGGVRLSED